MPRPQPTRRSAPAPAVRAEGSVRFGWTNALLLGAGAITIALGYLLLARGSTVAAPLLLVLGYVVLVPVGIIWQDARGGA